MGSWLTVSIEPDLYRTGRRGWVKMFSLQRAGSSEERHASGQESSVRPDRIGYAVQSEKREVVGESVIVKRVNSAFIDTDLKTRLRQVGALLW